MSGSRGAAVSMTSGPFERVIPVNLIGTFTMLSRTATMIAGGPLGRRRAQVLRHAALAAHIITNRMLNGEVIGIDGALRMPRG